MGGVALVWRAWGWSSAFCGERHTGLRGVGGQQPILRLGVVHELVHTGLDLLVKELAGDVAAGLDALSQPDLGHVPRRAGWRGTDVSPLHQSEA